MTQTRDFTKIDIIQVRAKMEITTMLNRLAKDAGISKSEWVRRSIETAYNESRE